MLCPLFLVLKIPKTLTITVHSVQNLVSETSLIVAFRDRCYMSLLQADVMVASYVMTFCLRFRIRICFRVFNTISEWRCHAWNRRCELFRSTGLNVLYIWLVISLLDSDVVKLKNDNFLAMEKLLHEIYQQIILISTFQTIAKTKKCCRIMLWYCSRRPYVDRMVSVL